MIYEIFTYICISSVLLLPYFSRAIDNANSKNDFNGSLSSLIEKIVELLLSFFM